MNCPSRTEPVCDDGWNQNPDALNADATTRADLSHMANARRQRDHCIDVIDTLADAEGFPKSRPAAEETIIASEPVVQQSNVNGLKASPEVPVCDPRQLPSDATGHHRGTTATNLSRKLKRILLKYAKFVGPGFMVAVAYIDPGNYATDVAAGASYRFKLLFIVLMSNIFAIFLQSLCIKLGTVTGMNLAENCKAHLPSWLNYLLYFFGESAIIATDIAEVIGTAIALNLLFHIPLVAGCAISIIDVLVILFFYSPTGTMRALRIFEYFVVLLVLGVAICFCFELSKIKASVREVFHGYLPSSTLVESQALYQACGILGATVMPHSLYLGSGIVQPRLREFEMLTNNTDVLETDSLGEYVKYRPSLHAIESCMSYSVVELAVSLFTFALFINSSILIVAGASLYGLPEANNADLFSIHHLLAQSIAPIAGTMFALALLLSGISAGIICTISGQIVSEGQLNWSIRPWLRRLITRSISITPSIIIAGAVGREGLAKALSGSQVALSVILPFVSAPLIWFTCRGTYMKVAVRDGGSNRNTVVANEYGERHVQMRNGWITTLAAIVIWGIIVIMNVALLVLVGLGLT